jgi:hypothetical protein
MEKKITNTEEANFYYKKINDLIHNYINEWNIKPSALKKFFSLTKRDKFLKKHDLNEVIGINQVFSDVLEDIESMEVDGVLTFEKFLIKENLLSIGKSDISHEKVIGDYYNIGLGHINPIDDDIHLYELTEFGKKINIFIYSKEEINKIKDVLRDNYLKEIKEKII